MGGVRIDRNGWSGIPGLYAAGEAAGGVHGASRIAGNSGSDVLVFGAVAGRGAATVPSSRSVRDWRRILGGATTVASCPTPDSGLRPEDVLETTRTLMSRELALYRSGDGLRRAVDALRALEESYLGGPWSPAPSWTAAAAAQRARGAVLTARMIAESALMRTESRGAHQRRDHPERNDAHWRRHVACEVDPTGELRVDFIAVQGS
jgi:succinate dehydrogenase/fumarate reductase flavoprotein subunit